MSSLDTGSRRLYDEGEWEEVGSGLEQDIELSLRVHDEREQIRRDLARSAAWELCALERNPVILGQRGLEEEDFNFMQTPEQERLSEEYELLNKGSFDQERTLEDSFRYQVLSWWKNGWIKTEAQVDKIEMLALAISRGELTDLSHIQGAHPDVLTGLQNILISRRFPLAA